MCNKLCALSDDDRSRCNTQARSTDAKLLTTQYTNDLLWRVTVIEFLLFTARCYAIRGTSRGPVSVCLCLSQVGVLLKGLNVAKLKQHHTIDQGV